VLVAVIAATVAMAVAAMNASAADTTGGTAGEAGAPGIVLVQDPQPDDGRQRDEDCPPGDRGDGASTQPAFSIS